MNAPVALNLRPLSIAILAMGGEGGGVLADWIVDLAERNGYLVQLTSVPGVAQRTGATIYYLEIFPRSGVDQAGRAPVMALMPTPGDVDVVIASELMEAGRAIQRGLVTPDRTTFIVSTNRVFAMGEKIALADGRVSGEALIEACRAAARTLHAFDMAALAAATGSVISAVLLGALAGARALPFERAAFEAAVRRGGMGVAASLAGFTAGFEAASAAPATVAAPVGATQPQAPHIAPALAALLSQAERDFPEPARAVVRVGVERVVDYQDLAYARRYLDRLLPIAKVDRDGRLTAETARQLALGMTYEDTIRVAELKIRPARFARVREEVKAADDQVVEIAEFMHPRVQEIADTLPAPLGRFLLRSGAARRFVERFTRRGRRVKTSSISGFLLLYLVAAMKPLRPRSLRFDIEQQALDAWLAAVARTAAANYDLAVEVAACRILVKGYGDTHERGRARFETLMNLLPDLSSRSDGATQFAALRKAASADESGTALADAINALKAQSAMV